MNLVTVENVVAKLTSRFRLREWQITLDEFVEDIADALKFIGAGKMYEIKKHTLVVNQKMAKLPIDCEHVKHLVPKHTPFTEMGSFLIIDKPDGTEIDMFYQALFTDTRGYPLIPDVVEVTEAIMWFLVRNLVLRKEVQSVDFKTAEAEWQWRCGSARAALNVFSVHQMNQIYQNFVRLNPRKDVHYNSYESIKSPNTLDRTKKLRTYPDSNN